MPMKITPRHITGLKAVIHLISLSFLALMIYQTLTGGLGADPVEGLSHFDRQGCTKYLDDHLADLSYRPPL